MSKQTAHTTIVMGIFPNIDYLMQVFFVFSRYRIGSFFVFKWIKSENNPKMHPNFMSCLCRHNLVTLRQTNYSNFFDMLSRSGQKIFATRPLAIGCIICLLHKGCPNAMHTARKLLSLTTLFTDYICGWSLRGCRGRNGDLVHAPGSTYSLPVTLTFIPGVGKPSNAGR